MEEGLLDETDIRFLLLIIRGYNNSYAIYTQLKKEAKEKSTRSMTYKNANRRILLLVQAGVIEEVKYTERVPHGRIDYCLSKKGLSYVAPHFIGHPEEMNELISHMDKFGLDKNPLRVMLRNYMEHATRIVMEYIIKKDPNYKDKLRSSIPAELRNQMWGILKTEMRLDDSFKKDSEARSLVESWLSLEEDAQRHDKSLPTLPKKKKPM